MIEFHEGLPGSGKTYEAVLSHVLPALKEGRHVYTNIRGLDYERIALHIGLAPVFLKDRIHATSPDPEPGEDATKDDHIARQMRFFYEAQHNALILWDEIQDFFPAKGPAFPSYWSEYVAAHRHRAQDFILMGQDHKDVHVLWRRRIERRVYFRKLSTLGRGNRYRWELFQRKANDKWEKQSDGFRKYDPAIFALYQSIRAEADQGHRLLGTDKNPFANSMFLRFGLPVFLLAFAWGIYTVYNIFAGDGFTPEAEGQHVAPGQKRAHPSEAKPAPLAVAQAYTPPTAGAVAAVADPTTGKAAAPGMAKNPEDFLAVTFAQNRAYVLGMVTNSNTGDWFVDVAFYDQGNQPFLRLDKAALLALARSAEPHPAGLKVVLFDGSTRIVTYRAAPDQIGSTAGAIDSYQRATAATGAKSVSEWR